MATIPLALGVEEQRQQDNILLCDCKTKGCGSLVRKQRWQR